MRFIQSIILALILGVSSVHAQDSTPEAPTEGSAPAQESPSIGDSTPVETITGEGEADPERPLEEIVAVHGDWQLRCRTDNGSCFMYQLALDSREVPISEVNIVPLSADDGRVAGFTIVTPLRTLLTEGVTLQIDNGNLRKYQFGWCTEAGCAARFAVREDGLNQFKRGNKLRLTVLSVEKPDAPVILDVSLKGFTAAFDDLSAR